MLTKYQITKKIIIQKVCKLLSIFRNMNKIKFKTPINLSKMGESNGLCLKIYTVKSMRVQK